MSVAVIEGELSLSSMPKQLTNLAKLQGSRIDMSACPRIDSAGAAFLLELARRNAKGGQKLEIINANEQARGLLRFFELDEVFAIA